MRLRKKLAQQREAFESVLAVATCRDSSFMDLWFPHLDIEAALRRMIENRDWGVMFEATKRVVVLEEFGSELRYYASGWCRNQNDWYLEQDRIAAEKWELGVFASVADAMIFAERYLVQLRAFEEITTPRQVRYGTCGPADIRDAGEESGSAVAPVE